MQTIVHAPLPIRSMSEDCYYFAQNKETARTVVVYLTDVYKTKAHLGKTVLVFGSVVGPNEIQWLSEEKFYQMYNLIGRVNRMIFE